jgi:RNA polymerase sigma factor (sigma-70 family)
MRTKGLVSWQKTRVVKTKPRTGERSAYWEWAIRHNWSDEDGVRESPRANPDILAEENTEDNRSDRLLMCRAIREAKLSQREKLVVKMIGLQGLTEEETARRLKIAIPTVHMYLTRARKKCLKMFVNKKAISGL